MAKSVIWSEEALRDIEGIAEYISRDSVYYAQQVATVFSSLSVLWRFARS